jgi:hypothetical protein
MISLDKKSLFGTIAIDRKQFYPFISQLFVIPNKRSFGIGNFLIKN